MTHPSASSKPTDGRAWRTELTANDSSAKEVLGDIRREIDDTYGICEYKYIRNGTSSAFSDGQVLRALDKFKRSGTTLIANRNIPIGVAFGAITASCYGWVQTKGYHDYVLTDAGGDIAALEEITAANVAGVAQRVVLNAAATIAVIGVAVADDNGTSVEANLCIPI